MAGNKILLHQALQTIRSLRQRLAENDQQATGPIAVIGMACRFPGGCSTPEAYWEFLREGRDAIASVPRGRWQNGDSYGSGNPPGISALEAGFLEEDVSQFDAHFFGISPREAIEMDPQQRLLLEICWEAMERAAINPAEARESSTGVFIGISGSEYAMLPRDEQEVSPYTATGLTSNIASGRIAYFFGFSGPALSVDTACSSSLVSVHLACESLRRRECAMALAGGVGLMLSSRPFIALSRLGALARDGRCKTFADSADGYGRGEGCGIVVLKTLAKAQQDGDQVLATIRGSAVNQDGARGGLTVPNGRAQKKLLEQALARAGVQPSQVSFLETHGTGTPLGDPIEIQAAAEVYARNRAAANPLFLGAVKANVGHLEAAAGIAGLIKAILCLQHQTIPLHRLHGELNPRFNLAQIPAIIPRESTRWEPGDGKRFAGVSSFGFSGTNAHVVLGEKPDPEPTSTPQVQERSGHILTFSARDSASLERSVKASVDYLTHRIGESLPDICYTMNCGRFPMRERVTFIVGSRSQLLSDMEAFLNHTPDPKRILVGSSDGELPSTITFAFGASIDVLRKGTKVFFDQEPRFRELVEACDTLFSPHLDRSVSDWVFCPRGDQIGINEAFIEKAACFSLNYALAGLWGNWGISPSAVTGNGIGLLAALSTAQVLTLDEAVRWVVAVCSDKEPRQEFCNLGTPLIDVIWEGWNQSTSNRLPEAALWNKTFSSRNDLAAISDALVRSGQRHVLFFGTREEAFYQASVASGTFSCFAALGVDGGWGDPLYALGQLHTKGWRVNWQNFDYGYNRKKLLLPTYPFQRKRYWLSPPKFGKQSVAPDSRISEHSSPLQGAKIDAATREEIWEFSLGQENFPEVRDNQGVLHVGHYQAMITSALKGWRRGSDAICFEDTQFLFLIKLPENGRKAIHLLLEGRDAMGGRFQIHAKDDSNNHWNLHVQGSVRTVMEDAPIMVPLETIQKRMANHIVGNTFYGLLEKHGFRAGPSLRWIDEVKYQEGEVIARFRSSANDSVEKSNPLGVPLGVFDSCAQLLLVAGSRLLNDQSMFMVVGWDKLIVSPGSMKEPLWCHFLVSENDTGAGVITANYTLCDACGRACALAENIRFRVLTKGGLDRLQNRADESRRTESAGEHSYLGEVSALSPPKRREFLCRYLTQVVAGALKIPIEELDVREPLRTLGMDSIVGIEVKLHIDRDFSISAPIELFIQSPTLHDLVEQVMPLLQEVDRHEEIPGVARTHNDQLDSNLWLVRRKNAPVPRVRLFCVPSGALGASQYFGWQERVPGGIEVCALQLPGRENRLKEKPVDDLSELIDVLESILIPELDAPYAFYGHSMGALVAYRLAYRLWKRAPRKPAHLFVGAYTPPIIPNPIVEKYRKRFLAEGLTGIPGPHDVEGHAAAQKFAREGLAQTTLLDVDEIAGALLKTMLADMKIVEGYEHAQEEPFDVPITAFHGARDQDVTLDEMQAWAQLTVSRYQRRVLPGDHFFMHKDQDRNLLINLIAEELIPMLQH
jgi:acyl transferase domain-containing protein/surfactin synthase thioesterase subunit